MVTLEPIADATLVNDVPDTVISTSFITILCPLVTVVPDATVTIGNDVLHAVAPTCTQVLLAVFLKILFETCVVLIAYEPIDPIEVRGAPVETPPTKSPTSVISIGVIIENV